MHDQNDYQVYQLISNCTCRWLSKSFYILIIWDNFVAIHRNSLRCVVLLSRVPDGRVIKTTASQKHEMYWSWSASHEFIPRLGWTWVALCFCLSRPWAKNIFWNIPELFITFFTPERLKITRKNCTIVYSALSRLYDHDNQSNFFMSLLHLVVCYIGTCRL